MPRKYVAWPNSEMDRLVQRFFERIGFPKEAAERYVSGYRLNREAGHMTTIEVTMVFDDEEVIQPQAEDFGPIDSYKRE